MLPQFLRKSELFKDGKFFQTLILSFSFMLLFTAFQTTSFIQQTVLNSLKKEDSSFTGDGYVALCIIYAVFAIGSIIAPSIVAILRSKWSMVASASIYVFFIAQFIEPATWLLYLTSALLGAGASLLWCAQGNFLTLSSDSKTISRNSGVFWAMTQCSLFFGNIFVFYQFQGKTIIDSETRVFVFIVLTVVAVCGVTCLLFLKNLVEEPSTAEESGQNQSEIGLSAGAATDKVDADASPTEAVSSPQNERVQPRNHELALSALIQALKLFITPSMLLLSIASIYTGWTQCFFFGVYSTSVGATLAFGDGAKRLVGLIGIFTGVGEVAGGTLFGLLGSKTTKRGRSPVVFLGLIVHSICYILIYLNLPENSPIAETNETSHLDPPQAWLAIVCALFLGFGDACYQTQLFAIFGSVYSDKSAAAFAIFKFTQSAASAIAFFSSSYMGIFAQMLTLLTGAILGFLGIFMVELNAKKAKKIQDDSASAGSSGIGNLTKNNDVPNGTNESGVGTV